MQTNSAHLAAELIRYMLDFAVACKVFVTAAKVDIGAAGDATLLQAAIKDGALQTIYAVALQTSGQQTNIANSTGETMVMIMPASITANAVIAMMLAEKRSVSLGIADCFAEAMLMLSGWGT